MSDEAAIEAAMDAQLETVKEGMTARERGKMYSAKRSHVSHDDGVTRAKGERVTRAKGERVTRAKGERVTRAKGERVTRAKGERVTRAKGERVTRAKGERVTRAKGERVTRAKGERVTRRKGERVTRRKGEHLTRTKGEHLTMAKGERVTRSLAERQEEGEKPRYEPVALFGIMSHGEETIELGFEDDGHCQVLANMFGFLEPPFQLDTPEEQRDEIQDIGDDVADRLREDGITAIDMERWLELVDEFNCTVIEDA